MVIADNWNAIKKTIRGVTDKPVAIVGVTKHQSSAKVAEAVSCGLTMVAVNYVQQGQALRQELVAGGVQWHFIGHVQSRKIPDLPAYDCVQSLDRLTVASGLNDRLETLSKRLDVLVEVNVGRELQKSGVLPDELDAFLEQVALLPWLRLRGLMAMPPFLEPVERRLPYFHQMSELFKGYVGRYSLDLLSMGTSDDFVEAIAAGSNMVRLGTALFGPRES